MNESTDKVITHKCNNCGYSGDNFEIAELEMHGEIIHSKIICPACNYENVFEHKPLLKLLKHCEFDTYGECYILSIIARTKCNNLKNSEQIMHRKIVKNTKDLIEGYNYLKNIAKNYPQYMFYMYISVNPRNMKKGLLTLIKLLLDIVANFENEETLNRINKLSGAWYSCLEKDSSRGSKRYHMIDLDNKNYYDHVIDYLKNENAKILTIAETKNGYHIVFKPIDVQKFNEHFEEINEPEKIITLKKDELMFVEILNEE